VPKPKTTPKRGGPKSGKEGPSLTVPPAISERRLARKAENEAALKMEAVGRAADLVLIHHQEVKEVLAPILTHYQGALETARKKREQEILATPNDGAAWAQELERRAGIAHRRTQRVRIAAEKTGTRKNG
jgi:hypothetical protein